MKKEKLQLTPQKYKSSWEQLYDSKMNNLEEMDKFSEQYNFPQLTHEETEDMYRPITST